MYQNYVRPHDALGKTPAEVPGIKVEGKDNWRTQLLNPRTNQRI
jgi:hypothetical protein